MAARVLVDVTTREAPLMLDFGRSRGSSSFDANRWHIPMSEVADDAPDVAAFVDVLRLDMPPIGIKAAGSCGHVEINHQGSRRGRGMPPYWPISVGQSSV
jgi:hypothetical protein